MGIRTRHVCIALSAAILILISVNLCIGTVHIPLKNTISVLTGGTTGRESWDFIILQSRIPSTLTAILAGLSLSASGLILQTAFNNPLAGPDILGINGGAGLGVAVVMMLLGGITAGTASPGGSVSVIAGAFIGAMAVMGIILLLSARLNSPIMLLIAGIMVSYLTSAAISLLNFFSTAEGVHSYMMWGMGNFGGVTLGQIPVYGTATLAGLAIAVCLTKALNAMLLGQYYAENLGINIRRTRTLLLISTGIMVATTTAFCGPVSFIGLAVPHIARLLLNNGNHRSLMPVCLLAGAATALLCNTVSILPGDRGLIPLNAVTPAIGAPVILYVLIKGKQNIRQ